MPNSCRIRSLWERPGGCFVDGVVGCDAEVFVVVLVALMVVEEIVGFEALGVVEEVRTGGFCSIEITIVPPCGGTFIRE